MILVRRQANRLLASLLFASVVIAGCSDVSFVERVTFVNGGDFPVRVEANDQENSGWLAIGIVEPNAETSFTDVLDMGELWVFRFRYLDHESAFEMSRLQLEQDDWNVQVPPELEAALWRAGLVPPP